MTIFDNEDAISLEEIRLAVEAELRNYEYEHPATAVGAPWSEGQIKNDLLAMRKALVQPYWTNVVLSDKPEQWNLSEPLIRRCVVVADNREDYLLLWDPTESDFLLGYTKNGRLGSIGIRGDAVGCFLAI